VIGSKLGHYQILAKLGEGGMGVVYLAEDDRLHRKVALKMLPPTLADDPHRLARFEREVKTVAALNHPNIVTIHSVEEEAGRRFFTMEHIEGRTLAQMIPLDGMPLKEFLKIAVPLAEALTAAHARGIQHRDLKPSNVMVTTDGRVKVLDFGLAKLKEHDRTEALAFKPETTLTQAGLAIGTLAYMSPEQLRMQATDHRSDIFSLGVVLFEMASGHAPFIGQSTAEVISSILRDQPARVYETHQNVPDELDQILRRCLEKEPAKRWSSAAELRDALAQVAAEVTYATSAPRVSRLAPGAPAPRRWPGRPAMLAAAAGLALLLAAGFAIWRVRSGASAAVEPGGAGLASLAPRAGVPSVAVLPLTSFSGEPEYFVDGITDALISSLARIEGLRVISRQSAMHFKGSQKLLPEIAKELGVEFVVEGSVARSGDSVRLNAQVIRADPETTLWSETFERRAEEVLALESSFATAVAGAINVQLSPTEQTRMVNTNSVDPAAYEAYLQGRYWAGKHGAESFRKAQGYFERAIAIDPKFANAWTDLAQILQRQGYFFADQEEKLAQAETAIRRALALDPQSADAHAAMADVHLGRWQWSEAEREVRRAVELEPNSAAAHLNYWRLLMRLRRFDESRREIELARALDPVSANITANYGYQSSIEGRCDEAIRFFDQALEIDPDFALVHAYAWYCYHELGRDPERGSELRGWLLAEELGEYLPELDRRLAADGYDETLSWIANELDSSGNPKVTPGLICGLLATAGEQDKAMRWLERGYDQRHWVLGWIATTNDLKSLRDRDDYRALVRKMNLPPPPSR
jgi:TolB-like protein/predicted Ser/Thr protein kinase